MRVALVIGLASYGSPAEGGLGRLSGPHLHALRMREKLLELAGFDTIVHRDLYGEPQSTRQGIYLAIQQFRDKLSKLPKEGDAQTVAFFYYSGHGGYNGKHHYLLPNDSRKGIDADVHGVDFEDSVLHHMAQHARLSIAVLDCCRTGDVHHQGAIPMLKAPPGHQYLVCYACLPFERAPDNGMFTNALLQHIFKSDRSFLELLGAANNEVAAAGGQEPQWAASFSFPPGFVLVNQVGWRFVQKQDFSTEFDFEREAVHSRDGIANVRQLAQAAERYGMTALAFNTQGHIKHTARGLVDMPKEQWRPEPAGVFVRDRRVPFGWLYFPGMDSQEGDSSPNKLEGTVSQMASEAEARYAVAFNTAGRAKDQLKPFSKWQQDVDWRPDETRLKGIFVRVCLLKEAPTVVMYDKDLSWMVKLRQVAKYLMASGVLVVLVCLVLGVPLPAPVPSGCLSLASWL